MIEPTRWSDDPRAPEGAAIFRYLEPPPPMPPELRRATLPRNVAARSRAPWIGVALAAIVLGGLALAAFVAFDGSDRDTRIVDVRQLDPVPETAPRVGGMHEAITPMVDQTPPPIVEEQRAPKPRQRTTTMAPPITRGQPSPGPGYLHVNSRPWSEVIIDGRRVGNTPIVRITLAEGAHQVTLISPTTGTRRTHRVQIRGGETTRLMVQLDSPDPLDARD